MRKRAFIIAGPLGLVRPGLALANQAAVTIEAPASAKKGEEITIKLNVTHSANAPVHKVRLAQEGPQSGYCSRGLRSAVQSPGNGDSDLGTGRW